MQCCTPHTLFSDHPSIYTCHWCPPSSEHSESLKVCHSFDLYANTLVSVVLNCQDEPPTVYKIQTQQQENKAKVAVSYNSLQLGALAVSTVVCQ